jgi:O-acetyl-ADP-ribose deacetylase (regulator of RNase III)
MGKSITFGNILDVTRGIIVHGCNNRGKMGAGLALQIRDKYPECYKVYLDHLKQYQGELGTVAMYQVNDNLFIANAITQDGFGRDGQRYVKYSAVYQAMMEIAKIAYEHDLHVHYPTIGATLGGGDWAILNEVIDLAFSDTFPEVNRTLWLLD